MPIGQYMKAGFYLFHEQDPLSRALARAEIKPHHFIVVPYSDGRYAAVRKTDLEAILDALAKQGGRGAYQDMWLGVVLESMAFQPVDVGSEAAAARRAVADQPGKYGVVVQDGQVVGILFAETHRSGGGDPQVVARVIDSLTPDAVKGIDEVFEEGRNVGADISDLGTSQGFTSAEPGSDEAEPAAGPRSINVEMRDQSGQQPFDPRQQPLQMNTGYRLLFSIGRQLAQAIASEELREANLFAEGEEEITLTVRLVSDDFECEPGELPMVLPRHGASPQPANFLILPLHEGPGTISAIFLKEYNYVQSMRLSFYTGSFFKVEKSGRTLETAFTLPRRDVNLTIFNTGTAFNFTLTGPVGASASLPLNPTQLDALIGKARQALLEVVNTVAGGKRVYQQGIDISPKTSQASALILAQAGFRLYQKIFFGAKADLEARLLGQRLRMMAEGGRMNIQVFSTEFLLPWGLLYLSEEMPQSAAEVDLERFLGMRHVIEHIPWQTGFNVLDSEIDITEGLQVSLNVNTDIDQEMDKPFVVEQLEEWEEIRQRGEALVSVRRSSQEVLQALKSGSAGDQVMYFYCHAASHSLADGEDPGESALMLSGRKPVYLDDLQTSAGTDHLLPGSPLVFLNACQSAELSPLFYEGFVPYFMDKGARGVIGTECDIPAVFARHFASAFFQRFLQGEALGEIVLALRREYAEQHHNLLGLLYAVYVDADTRLKRA
jgi:hypothetical protein